VAQERAISLGWPAVNVVSWCRAVRLLQCLHVLPNGRVTHLVNGQQRPVQATPEVALPLPGVAAATAEVALLRCASCGLRGNAWLNLTDGAVHCGRRQYDGSGGNGCALKNASANKSTLVVKLGTVRVDLSARLIFADVFSYARHDEVLDPKLALRLALLGLDPANPGGPPASSVADLVADLDRRQHEAVARWCRWPVRDVPELLASMPIEQRNALRDLFARASRVGYGAQRGRASPAVPLAPPVLLASLEAQMEALWRPREAALLAEETAALVEQHDVESEMYEPEEVEDGD
jgi:Zn-finger in ubiquitin-hydrolases and other protein